MKHLELRSRHPCKYKVPQTKLLTCRQATDAALIQLCHHHLTLKQFTEVLQEEIWEFFGFCVTHMNRRTLGFYCMCDNCVKAGLYVHSSSGAVTWINLSRPQFTVFLFTFCFFVLVLFFIQLQVHLSQTHSVKQLFSRCSQWQVAAMWWWTEVRKK